MPGLISKRLLSTAGWTRLSIIGTVLGIVAAVLLLALVLGRDGDSAPTEEQAKAPVETPEPVSPEELPPAIAYVEEPAPSIPARPPEETTAAPTGRGRIYGTVVMAGDEALPEDMRVVLHRYDSESKVVSHDDTLLQTVTPGSEGAFDFKRLALGSYIIFASSASHTANTSATLTRARSEQERTLQAVPGGAISGRVINENQEPVEGAHVFAAATDIGPQERNLPRGRTLASRVTTDVDGAFVMVNLHHGAPGEKGYRLAAKAEGYATHLSDYMVAGTQDAELTLTLGGMVIGQLVRAGTGEPVPGKTIALDSKLSMENLSTFSDTEGWFILTEVPPGAHRARLVDDELVLVPETAGFEVTEGEETPDILIEVAMGGRITGRVFDGDTGAGIARAKLRAVPEGFSLPAAPSADTDSQGRYEIKGLDPGSYGLRLDKPEGYPEDFRSSRERTRSVTARLESETSGVDFELTKGIQIFGKVVDEEGRPLAQVGVNARVDRGNASDYGRTERDGSFVLAGFPPNVTVRVSAGKSGFATDSTEPEGGRVEIEEDNVTGVRIVMGPGSSISGFVVDTFGNPKAGIQMYARRIDSNNLSGNPIEQTSADGAISFDQLSAGKYRIQFWQSGRSYEDMTSPIEDIQLAKGEKVTGLRLVYDEPEGLTISGRVTDTQGKPVPRASMRVQGPTYTNARAEMDGTYTVTGLGEGTYTVIAADYRHSPSEPLQAAAGSRNVDFVLSQLAAIEGQVLSARTGAPITSFQVRAEKLGGTRYYTRDQFVSVSDPEGRFKLPEVEEGAATVTARADGYSEDTADVNAIVGGETVSGVVLRLEDGAKLAGHVVDRSGGPVSSAQIFLGPVPNGEWQRDREAITRTNKEGEFKLTSLPAGDVTLSASHREYTPESVSVSLSRFSENQVEIVLRRGGVVEGYVRLGGTPQPDQTVSGHVERVSQNAQTDANGHYRLVGLPDGMTTIVANLRVNETYRNQMTQAQVADDMTTTVDFDFAPGSSSIEGVVYQDEATPLQQQAHLSASIDLGGGLMESFSTQTGLRGAFLFEGLPAGLVNLALNAQGYPPKSISVELGDRQTIHQDIFLFGGATIICEVSGATEVAVAAAITGAVDIPDLNMEFIQQISQAMASQAQIVDGVARLSGLEPGTYTILVLIYDQAAMQAAMEDGTDPFASAQWQSSVVEVEKDQETAVQFSF